MALVAQLRVAVVLDDHRPVARRPGEEVHPAGDRHRAAVRVLPRGRDEHAPTAPSGSRSTSSPRSSTGTGIVSIAEAVERAPEMRRSTGPPSRASARRTATAGPAVANAPWAPGRHDDLLRRRPDRPGHPEVGRQLGAQARVALRPAVRRRRLRVRREVAPRAGQEPLPDGRREQVEAGGAGPEVEPRVASGCPRRTAAAAPPTPRAGRGRVVRRAAGPRQRPRPEPAPQVGQPGRDDASPARVAPRGSPRRSAARRPSSPSPRRRRGAARRPGSPAAVPRGRSARRGSTGGARPRSGGRAAGSPPGRGRSADRAPRISHSCVPQRYPAGRRRGSIR